MEETTVFSSLKFKIGRKGAMNGPQVSNSLLSILSSFSLSESEVMSAMESAFVVLALLRRRGGSARATATTTSCSSG